jgi:hypothetical protein
MAAAITLVSPRLVTSGYFRNNLYVLLGLNVLAALIAFPAAQRDTLALWPPLTAAILSYTASVLWLYDKSKQGRFQLAAIAAICLVGAWLDSPAFVSGDTRILVRALNILSPITSGAVLGSTMAAMLLGHWYLNSPGMKIAPLQRLIAVMLMSLAAQTVVSAIGLAMTLQGGEGFTSLQWALLGLRWLAGLAGSAAMAVMARATLKIPNTQSATGILYVAVMFTFLGELSGLLLSTDTLWPV